MKTDALAAIAKRSALLLALWSPDARFSSLHATVTTVAWYSLGDNDPGAAEGQTAKSTTADLLGVNPLKRLGSPHYTSATDPNAADHKGVS